MKQKTFSSILLVSGALLLLIGLLAPLIPMIRFSGQPSVGIIGAADAPSYWFIAYAVMDGWPVYADFIGGLAVMASLVIRLCQKHPNKP